MKPPRGGLRKLRLSEDGNTVYVAAKKRQEIRLETWAEGVQHHYNIAAYQLSQLVRCALYSQLASCRFQSGVSFVTCLLDTYKITS